MNLLLTLEPPYGCLGLTHENGVWAIKKTPQANRVTFGLQMHNIGYKSGYKQIA